MQKPIRPDLTSDAVIIRALMWASPDLCAWVERHTSKRTKSEVIVAHAAVAIKEAGADGFRAATRLKESIGWPADYQLCRILQSACDKLDFALRLVIAEWVVETGLRFPASEGDTIHWKSQGVTRAGLVHTVIAREAAAVVKPVIGTALSGDLLRVAAEQVVTPAKRTIVTKGA